MEDPGVHEKMAGRRREKNTVSTKGKRKSAAALKIGSRIAIIAPASPFDRRRFLKAVRWLAEQGLQVTYRRSVFSRRGYLAGSDARRLNEFVNAWKDPAIDGIFAARGGYGSMRLLEILEKNKTVFRGGSPVKLVTGMSDLTVLLNHIALETGTVTVHGPVLAGDLFEAMGEAKRKRWLSSFRAPRPVLLRSPRDFRVGRPGKAAARLWGGNLSMVGATVGTRFEIPSDGILFLEEVSEPRYRVDRMFAQLALADFFRKIRGLILGDFTDLSGKSHPASWLRELVRRYLGSRKVPVLFGLRAGHKHGEVLLPIGGWVRIEANGRRLILPPLVQGSVR